MDEIRRPESPMNKMFSMLVPGSIFPTPDRNYLLPMVLPILCYRGQADYDWNLQPSVERAEATLSKGGLSDDLCALVSEMRVQEFRKMLETTRRAEAWRAFRVPYPKKGMLKEGLFLDYRSIAQHYGVPTDIVDFTNDGEVALFFASCRYDGEEKEYRPVDRRWISEHPYGSMYSALGMMETTDHRPCDMQGLEFMSVQPFGRPVLQSGFALRKSCPGFSASKCRFERDVGFAEEIYEHFDGGRRIFPDEGLDWLTEEVDRIMSSRSFSKEAFKRGYRETGHSRKDERVILRHLAENGYGIGRNAYGRSDSEIHGYDKGWSVGGYLESMGLPDPSGSIYFLGDTSDELILGEMKSKLDYMLGCTCY